MSVCGYVCGICDRLKNGGVLGVLCDDCVWIWVVMSQEKTLTHSVKMNDDELWNYEPCYSVPGQEKTPTRMSWVGACVFFSSLF